MHPGTQHRSSFLVATRVVLLLALVAVSLTLTQRRLVSDRPTSLSVVPVARSGDCVKGCNDTFIAQLKSEHDLHKLLLKNCGRDAACEANEDARHKAALQAIQLGRQACKNGCLTQNAGTAGT